jgi:Holliday junction DNA helicase RuvB
MKDSIIDPVPDIDEISGEATLRPRTLDEYIGQEELKRNLRVFIEAAKARSMEALDSEKPLSPISSPTSLE